MFQKEVKIRFSDTDPAGILFYSKAFELIHGVYEDFVVESLGVSWKEWFQNTQWALPVVQAEARFFHPMVADQVYLITLELIQKTTSSFTLAYEIKKESHVFAKLKTSHVFIDQTTREKLPLPKEIRQRDLSLKK